MIRRQTLRALLALAACFPMAQPVVAADADLAAALELYQTCHWRQAFAAFTRLADAGDREAARIARQMARHGPALYGQSFEITQAQTQRWAQTARVAVGAAR
jgi:hypothetical protein